jgi:hypothetical protein
MRLSILALAAAFGLMAAPSLSSAAPAFGADLGVTSPAPIVQVRGGCGPGFHPAWWRDRGGRPHRRCVPNRRW